MGRAWVQVNHYPNTLASQAKWSIETKVLNMCQLQPLIFHGHRIFRNLSIWRASNEPILSLMLANSTADRIPKPFQQNRIEEQKAVFQGWVQIPIPSLLHMQIFLPLINSFFFTSANHSKRNFNKNTSNEIQIIYWGIWNAFFAYRWPKGLPREISHIKNPNTSQLDGLFLRRNILEHFSSEKTSYLWAFLTSRQVYYKSFASHSTNCSEWSKNKKH